MSGQELKKGSEVLQKYDYGYGELDFDGCLKNNGKLESVVSHIGPAKQWTQKFKYDSVGRLSEAEEKRGDTDSLTYKQKFDFDRFGNLYRKVSSNPTTGQQNPLPFTPIEDGDISKSTNRFVTGTTYDEAGEVVTDNKFRSMNFAYDANGRQVKVTRTGALDAHTVYDGLGNRVATKINDVWQYIVYDAFGKLIAEYGTASEGLGGVKYIQQDHQGSVRTVTSNTGFVVSRTDNLAFGEEIGAGIGLRTAAQGFGVSNPSRQGYGLTEKDDATGLNHTWFRKNENRAGRWTSPDPYKGSMSLANPQSFNRYSYVENDPTNSIDPSGLIALIERPWDGWWPGSEYRFFMSRAGGSSGGGGGTSSSGRGGSLPPAPPPNSPEDCKLFQDGDEALKSFLQMDYYGGGGVEGRLFGGNDVFTFARVIYAEASNNEDERDAVASVFINRVVSQGRPNLTSLANSGQFQAVTGNAEHRRAFERAAPDQVKALSSGDCESLRNALNVALRTVTQGARYPQFVAFRGRTTPLRPGMTIIGRSRFAASDAIFNPPRQRRR